VIRELNIKTKKLFMVRPRMTDDEYSEWLLWKGDYKGIVSAANKSGVDVKSVKNIWLKDKKHSIFAVNPEYEKPSFNLDNINWDDIIKPLGLTQHPIAPECDNYCGEFDRVVYTDVHIGMDTNADGFSLYGGKWDEKELDKRLEIMLTHIIGNQMSNHLILDDLGDFMDGWDAHTVRRQHPLPQNMDNQKAFDAGLSFKLKMIDKLSNHYNKITIHNVCEDNHAGSFGYVVNSAFKKVCEYRHPEIEVINYRKFINHYSVGKHLFIITHGKDGKNLKFGFKPKLDPAQIEKIDNYIKESFLHQKGVKIEFSKGDSHQFLLDWSTSDSFNYFNYPAFSPSSNWIQTNYKKGKSGFVMFNYLKTQVSLLPCFFKWD